MSEQPLEAQAANLKANAGQIREQVKAEYAGARSASTPEAYREALIRVRTLQDSLEEYVAFAIGVKGAMERAAADAKAAYDDMWAASISRAGQSTARNGPEMEGPRERYAKVDLVAFAELRAYRQTQKALILGGELLDEMWLRYRAVNATREDLANILRAYAFESSLEH